MSRPSVEIDGCLVINSWAGQTRYPVLIVGETPKRYCIQAIEQTRLGGRNRWLEPGKETLVPKEAVQLHPNRKARQSEKASPTESGGPGLN